MPCQMSAEMRKRYSNCYDPRRHYFRVGQLGPHLHQRNFQQRFQHRSNGAVTKNYSKLAECSVLQNNNKVILLDASRIKPDTQSSSSFVKNIIAINTRTTQNSARIIHIICICDRLKLREYRSKWDENHHFHDDVIIRSNILFIRQLSLPFSYLVSQQMFRQPAYYCQIQLF